MSSEDGFLAALDASTTDVNEAITLPPACYTSEEFLAFERRAIFDQDWVCVGHEGQIANAGHFDDLPWNWKVMLENFVDGYHNNRLHSGIGDVMPCSDANGISIQIGYLFHHEVVEMPMFDVRFAQAKADVDNFNGADIHADTTVQVGLRSRFAPRAPYSWQEATLQQINRWLVKRYREHYRRDPAPVRAAGL